MVIVRYVRAAETNEKLHWLSGFVILAVALSLSSLTRSEAGVTISPALARPGQKVHIAVDARDNTRVDSVTANGITLTLKSGTPAHGRWEGDLTTAVRSGTQPVSILMTDCAGNIGT